MLGFPLSAYLPGGYLAPSIFNPSIATPIYVNARAPRALDRVTGQRAVCVRIKSSVSASYVHLLDTAGGLSEILTAS